MNLPEHSGVIDFGGAGPPILLLHGLMGRASTWRPLSSWLARYGRVIAPDARGHGRGPRGGPWHTEQFVADAAATLRELAAGPAIVIGHSMGGLHGMCLAATRPELVRALVIEDFAPDQRGRTVETWRPYFDSWPVPFRSLAQVREFFGTTGDYFVECFEWAGDGYRLTALIDDLYAIAAEWGRRDYWSFVDRVRCPVLVAEAEYTLMPPGQQAELAARARAGQHVLVPGANHVVHDEPTGQYRGAVEAFLAAVLFR